MHRSSPAGRTPLRGAPCAWALAVALLAAGPALAESLEGGPWKVIRAERGGEPNAAELNAVLSFADGKLTLVSPEGENVEFDYTVDPGHDPAHIDLARGVGDKRFTLRGIWKVTDGQFSLCLGAPFSDRPTAFATSAGKATSLTIHERTTN